MSRGAYLAEIRSFGAQQLGDCTANEVRRLSSTSAVPRLSRARALSGLIRAAVASMAFAIYPVMTADLGNDARL